MPAIADLPHVLALLNAISLICLIIGFRHIKAGDRAAHRAAMLGAVAASVLFLVVYVYYHANAGLAKFGGEGPIRTAYFTLLIVHILMSTALLPLVPMTLIRALKGRFDGHRKIARKTWPVWIFVTTSGLVVYAMAVHLYPHGGG